MSEDKARLSELQSALRAKMADNKTIADSFKIEDGNVVVSSAQKTAFDKNMQDIKEIKSLISGLEQMSEVDSWGSQASGESVAAAVAAGAAQIGMIASQKFDGGGSASVSSPSSGGSALSGGGAPQFNTVGTSGFNQVAGSIADQNQEPIQAYVVSTDITSQQSLDRNRRNKSAF